MEDGQVPCSPKLRQPRRHNRRHRGRRCVEGYGAWVGPRFGARNEISSLARLYARQPARACQTMCPWPKPAVDATLCKRLHSRLRARATSVWQRQMFRFESLLVRRFTRRLLAFPHRLLRNGRFEAPKGLLRSNGWGAGRQRVAVGENLDGGAAHEGPKVELAAGKLCRSAPPRPQNGPGRLAHDAEPACLHRNPAGAADAACTNLPRTARSSTAGAGGHRRPTRRRRAHRLEELSERRVLGLDGQAPRAGFLYDAQISYRHRNGLTTRESR